MKITIEKIGSDHQKTLRNLYSLYLHDLSVYADSLQVSEDGSFEFDSFELIWTKDGINPYIFRADGELAGFILLLEKPFTKKVDVLVNDFFVLNRYRGKGVAKEAAARIFAEHKGQYYISQLKNNEPAVRFWRKMYKEWEVDFEEYTEMQDDDEVIYQKFFIK